VAADADELTRLHVEAGLSRPVDDAWRSTRRDDLAERLANEDPYLLAFVIDTPTSGPACGVVGFISNGISRPGNPSGLTVHIGSVTTMPACRRRGYATAAVSAFFTEAKSRGARGPACMPVTGRSTCTRRLGFTLRPNAMSLDWD
jgi:ribosomal protein S18 acetylase RimI-like enzyme